ncbi:hypothetical protein M3Y99_00518900 [Aphelenchoides fujianensis]|nr:hypothetical protein M3Y99_00518900 [Aphelenchoides fujianensis]
MSTVCFLLLQTTAISRTTPRTPRPPPAGTTASGRHADRRDHAHDAGFAKGDQADWARLDYGDHKRHESGDSFAEGFAHEHGDDHGRASGHDGGHSPHSSRAHHELPHHFGHHPHGEWH